MGKIENTPQIFVVDSKHGPIAKAFNSVVAFGSLGIVTWLVNTQMPPNGWINFTVCLCWVLLCLGYLLKTRNKFTPDEARAWLNEKYPREGVK